MSLLEHYIKLAFKGGEDAKLESAKVFFKFSEQSMFDDEDLLANPDDDEIV